MPTNHLNCKPRNFALATYLQLVQNIGAQHKCQTKGELMFVIFDIDGTLADLNHRLPLITGTNRNWNAFYEACKDDAPIQAMIDALVGHANCGDTVEIWSGRSAHTRAETEAWLDAHVFEGASKLLKRMRPTDSREPDYIMKNGWLDDLEAEHKGRPEEMMVYDDRPNCITMWRDRGVPCVSYSELKDQKEFADAY